MFFNLGGPEILVIAMVALIAVGPDQLPGVLRKLGRFMAQTRSMTAGLRSEFMSGLDEVKDIADPKQWMGSGTDNDPVVPRGFAKDQDNGDSDGNDGTAKASPGEPEAASNGSDREPVPELETGAASAEAEAGTELRGEADEPA